MQRDNLEYTGFPQGGSLRRSGTLLHNSAEFQAVLQRAGDSSSASRSNHGSSAGHLALRGLWE